MKDFFKKHWKKKIAPALGVIGFVGTVTGLWMFIDWLMNPGVTKEYFDEVSIKAGANMASAFNAVGKQQAVTDAKIDNTLGFDCSVGDSWEGAGKQILVENNKIYLADGTEAGSIRFPTPVNDVFTLSLNFIPDSTDEDGIGFTVSVKDDFDNEFSITIGDGDNTSSHYVYKERGIVKASGTAVVSNIQKKRNIELKFATIERASSLLVTAYLVYPYQMEGDGNLRANLMKDLPEIPFFSANTVYLHLGLRRGGQEPSPSVQIAKCRIKNNRQLDY